VDHCAITAGFVRVAACSLPVHLADPAANATAIGDQARAAADSGAALVVFPELSVTGYSLDDLFMQSALLDATTTALAELAEQSRDLPAALVVGAPLRVTHRLYNCAVVIAGGRILGAVPKSYLPNYREFYEHRQFASGVGFEGTTRIADAVVPVTTKQLFDISFGSPAISSAAPRAAQDDQDHRDHQGDQDDARRTGTDAGAGLTASSMRLGIEICEDLWVPIPPGAEAALAGAEVIVNISGSPITVAKARERRRLSEVQSAKLICGYVYAASGKGESSTDLSWDGQTLIFERGELLAQGPRFADAAVSALADLDLALIRQDRLRQGTFDDNRVAWADRIGRFQTVAVQLPTPARPPMPPTQPGTAPSAQPDAAPTQPGAAPMRPGATPPTLAGGSPPAQAGALPTQVGAPLTEPGATSTPSGATPTLPGAALPAPHGTAPSAQAGAASPALPGAALPAQAGAASPTQAGAAPTRSGAMPPTPSPPAPLAEPSRPTRLMREIARFPFVPDDRARLDQDCYEAYNIQVSALVKRLTSIGEPKVVIGVSGGLDSSHALIVAAKAMDQLGRPRADILAYTMPGFGTTHATKANAAALANALSVSFEELDIRAAARQMLADIHHPFARGHPDYDITFENVQAGLRTDYLFRIANYRGGIVLGTGDLSELALGWCTYGVGDQMSHYNVNAGVPKTLIQYLIRWVVKTAQFDEQVGRTLQAIVETEISPELVPPGEGGDPQSTQSVIGPYPLQDFTLYYTLRFGLTPSQVFFRQREAWEDPGRGRWPDGVPAQDRRGYGPEALVHWLEVFYRRFFWAQFKRSALPNGPKVVRAGSLSPRGDWRQPSDATGELWRREIDALKARFGRPEP
jgi:NAD+ synthetase